MRQFEAGADRLLLAFAADAAQHEAIAKHISETAGRFNFEFDTDGVGMGSHGGIDWQAHYESGWGGHFSPFADIAVKTGSGRTDFRFKPFALNEPFSSNEGGAGYDELGASLTRTTARHR